MTILMPTCAEVTALLTDYEERALGPLDWLGLKLHLGLCPPCRAFLASFHRTAPLLRSLWGEAPSPAAERALDAALAALREGRAPRGPVHHPDPEAWRALDAGGDPLLALLLRVHLGQCGACRDQRGAAEALEPGENPLEALRPHLAPEAQWRWTRRGLGGAQVVRVLEDPSTGATLSLARMPGGRSMPRHDHCGSEQSLILRGALQDGPARLGRGDWITHGPGQAHGPTAGAGDDCWALIRLEGGIRFTGWRGLLGVLG